MYARHSASTSRPVNSVNRSSSKRKIWTTPKTSTPAISFFGVFLPSLALVYGSGRALQHNAAEQHPPIEVIAESDSATSKAIFSSPGQNNLNLRPGKWRIRATLGEIRTAWEEFDLNDREQRQIDFTFAGEHRPCSLHVLPPIPLRPVLLFCVRDRGWPTLSRFERVGPCSTRSLPRQNLLLPAKSLRLVLLFRAAIVCHCMFDGSSAPPHSGGFTWSIT
jgi:hypothetical protein